MSDEPERYQLSVTSGLYRVSPTVIRGVIFGSVENKSNRRRIVPTRFGPRIIKDPAAIAWVDRVGAAVMYSRAKLGELPLAEKGVHLYASSTVFAESWRRDLDVELLYDALQKAGVVENDRQIREKHSYGRTLDPVRPRIVFEIGVCGEEEA